MFTTRLISGIVLVLIALLTVGSGGVLLFATTIFISMIGLFELYRVFKIHNHPLGYMGYLIVLVYYGLLWFQMQQYALYMSIVFMMLLLCFYVFAFPKYKTEEVTGAFFGFFYVAVMLSYLYQIRAMDDGKYLVWLVFLSSWGCDTCAYCVGNLIGKHKLAPVLSPHKSIEGAVGGILGASLLGFLYATFFGASMTVLKNPQITCTLACAFAALISPIGDLAASGIKRNHNVKDYGRLIPGHGGILDRFDSMLFTAPVIYFVVTFVR